MKKKHTVWNIFLLFTMNYWPSVRRPKVYTNYICLYGLDTRIYF